MGSLLDGALSDYQFSERHRIRIDASPEAALVAATEVSFAEMPLARLLMRVRGKRTPTRGSLWTQMVAGGFVELGEIPGSEAVIGLIGQMWKLSGGHTPKVSGAVEFAAFRDPGYAKAAMSLAAHEVNGRCELLTETRVFVTDETARRAFSRYWLVRRPGSAVIRRVWLGTAKRRAEKRLIGCERLPSREWTASR